MPNTGYEHTTLSVELDSGGFMSYLSYSCLLDSGGFMSYLSYSCLLDIVVSVC